MIQIKVHHNWDIGGDNRGIGTVMYAYILRWSALREVQVGAIKTSMYNHVDDAEYSVNPYNC